MSLLVDPLSLTLRYPSEGYSGDGAGGHAAEVSQAPTPLCVHYFWQCPFQFYLTVLRLRWCWVSRS